MSFSNWWVSASMNLRVYSKPPFGNAQFTKQEFDIRASPRSRPYPRWDTNWCLQGVLRWTRNVLYLLGKEAAADPSTGGKRVNHSGTSLIDTTKAAAFPTIRTCSCQQLCHDVSWVTCSTCFYQVFSVFDRCCSAEGLIGFELSISTCSEEGLKNIVSPFEMIFSCFKATGCFLTYIGIWILLRIVMNT